MARKGSQGLLVRLQTQHMLHASTRHRKETEYSQGKIQCEKSKRDINEKDLRKNKVYKKL